MSKVKKVPEIRFAGFAEPWEQRKLLDCIQKITDFRGRTPKKLGMDWSDSGYLALSALNVKDGYIDFSQDVHYGNQALYDKWMVGNELHEGQVLFTTEAPMGNVAQVPDNKRYILSQRTIAFDVRENFITENFLAAVLKSPAVFETLIALSSGGTAKGVSQKSLTAVDITLPRDLDEQSQLATVFSKINNLLTLYQRKLDRLIVLKQAMLEKMFPQKGNTIPEVRFAGFTAPWEQWEFEDIATRSSIISSESCLPRVEYEDIISGAGILNKDLHTKESKKAGIVFHAGDVLYGKLRPYLQNWLLPKFSGLAVGDFWVLHPQNVDSSFLYRLIQSRQFEEVANQSTGTKMPRADWNLVSKTEFFIPSTIDEQILIGTYFEQLDHLITLQQRKYESLKHIKAALLQKMFV